MKKTLAILLALMMLAAVAACGETTDTPETSPTPTEEVSPVTPDEATPDEPVDVPTPDEPIDVTTPDEPAVVDDTVVELTATGVQDNYYLFDLSTLGMGLTGYVYALYFDDGATVTFPVDTDIISIDAVTYAQTPTPYAAGTVINVADVNGQTVSIGSGNSICFVLASDPGNYTGMVADKPLAELPENVVLTVA
ncbi:MAG: hypothetical protein LBK23_02595 [Oscillospiraceae bacterium]|nr:hypothetical protein [Oscillospiraceae bacterium]